MNINYQFKNEQLLETALTHTSYANEKGNGTQSNERLEFLGDCVLEMIVSDHLYQIFPELSEGPLTQQRAALVCEKALFDYAKQIQVGNALKLGKGEQASGGKNRPSLLADAFEAIIAAIYLDGGYNQARDFVLPFIERALNNKKKPNFRDYKTELQEIIQQNPEEKVQYRLVGETGPDHDKKFDVEVHLNSNVIGQGSGKSKKDAEQQAAKSALEMMGY